MAILTCFEENWLYFKNAKITKKTGRSLSSSVFAVPYTMYNACNGLVAWLNFIYLFKCPVYRLRNYSKTKVSTLSGKNDPR